MKPSPKPANGQHWRDEHKGTVRRVVDASDPWFVMMENVVTGRQTKVFRVSEWGKPVRYVHVPKSPEVATKEQRTLEEVHIRFQPGEGPRLTYCLKPVDNLITTTLENLPFWRKRRTICAECDRRRKDGTATMGDLAGAA